VQDTDLNFINITYLFKFPDGTEIHFPLTIDESTLTLVDHTPDHLPKWADLDYHKCRHCPLLSDQVSHCPLTVSLVPVVKEFMEILSYDSLILKVTTAERTVVQKTTAQRALSSFMGILIAFSGCPHTEYFKPMARFHLPLASEAETIYRCTSMYLLAQYFRMREFGNCDFSLKGLEEIYTNMQKVNTSLVERLRNASKADSYVNAIIMLDMYAKAMPLVIDDSLEEIRYLFAPYLKKAD
jgi:hypothetical protein